MFSVLMKIWRKHKGFMLFIGMMFVFRSAVADWSHIPSSSMQPTLIPGDRVGVNKLAYSLRVPFTLTHIVQWRQPQRGDVITFDSPVDSLNLIKRVIAVEGDVISMKNNQLMLNGRWLPKKILNEHQLIKTESGDFEASIWDNTVDQLNYSSANIEALNRYKNFEPVQVPVGHVLVLGDNRDMSNDSRFIGFIPVSRITGRAEKIIMSLNPMQYYLPRANRWWQSLSSEAS